MNLRKSFWEGIMGFKKEGFQQWVGLTQVLKGDIILEYSQQLIREHLTPMWGWTYRKVGDVPVVKV